MLWPGSDGMMTDYYFSIYFSQNYQNYLIQNQP